MTAQIVLVIPVLGRPHRVASLMMNVAAATPEPHRLLFIATGTDHDEIAALRDAGADHLVLNGDRQLGDYSRKINIGIAETTEPLVFTGADDLDFHPGWLPAATRRLGTAAEWVERPLTPDALIGVVGTNDLGNSDVVKGVHATHSVVTRAYIDDFGTIDRRGRFYHEVYDHNYCDVEAIETAKVRDAFVHAADSVVEHLHPSWNKGIPDATYELGVEHWRDDMHLWRHRRRLLRAQRRSLAESAG